MQCAVSEVFVAGTQFGMGIFQLEKVAVDA
jgi:hypothetical protein